MIEALSQAIANTRQHLLAMRHAQGHWEGELSSSALATATAIVALHGVDAQKHQPLIEAGARWLVAQQNADGGWGDTTISTSNLSTTLLCWSALHLCRFESHSNPIAAASIDRRSYEKAETWITSHVGSLEPDAIADAVLARYGKDRTFSVPILMLCTIAGTMGSGAKAWRRVLPLPFELAELPRSWFGAVGLPVVSYALPALIAIGYTRFHNAPPPWWSPIRWLRGTLWPRIRPMLKSLQPSSGGYLEATPLTSFVTMALAAAGEKDHPCVPLAVEFLARSMREDGSWPIDTNLATWGTTLATKALFGGPHLLERREANPLWGSEARVICEWLLAQQYQIVHPFTNAAPGGWAWTDLPGGVPDADDTAGALIALWHLCDSSDERRQLASPAQSGITWLLNVQNRDGGMPTFCRGWGALPFDHSTPELTAHALLAWWLWEPFADPALQRRIQASGANALRYLQRVQRPDGSWLPLWFGNEHALEEHNPVYGTAQVVACLSGCARLAGQAEDWYSRGMAFLRHTQKANGAWGGDAQSPPSIEETALALQALSLARAKVGHGDADEAIEKAVDWLLDATRRGTRFQASPIGLYFARLWYHESLYPVIWTLQALQSAKAALSKSGPPARNSSIPHLP